MWYQVANLKIKITSYRCPFIVALWPRLLHIEHVAITLNQALVSEFYIVFFTNNPIQSKLQTDKKE